VRPLLADHPDFGQRLAHEARVAAKLRHPNIVQVYEFNEIDGEYYLAMEFVDGVTLNAVMRACARRNARIPVGVACQIASQIANGLAYAHSLVDEQGRECGIVHRNLNPGNIMVTTFGAVKLLDFGVACAVDGVARAPQCVATSDERGYLAPEQVEGRTIDRRSDLFALGVVLYELLTMWRFRPATPLYPAVRSLSASERVAPSALATGIAADLDAIVLKLLAPAPEQRFASAEVVVDALTPIVRRLQADTVALQDFLFCLGPVAESFRPRAGIHTPVSTWPAPSAAKRLVADIAPVIPIVLDTSDTEKNDCDCFPAVAESSGY
jgi:serine/threonine protein kinase